MAPRAEDSPALDLVSADLERVQLISKTGEVPPCFLQKKPVVVAHKAEAGKIPLIDLSGYFGSDPEARREVENQIARACEDGGFFQLVNHGVPLSVLKDGMDAAKRFFALPDEVKQKYAFAPRGTSRNWSGYGRFVQLGNSELEWQDTFFHYDPVVHGPGGIDWPEQPADYADKMGEYKRQLYEVLKTLHEITCNNLGLPSTYLEENVSQSKVVRVNYYPPCSRPEDVLGLNAHTDVSTYTILYQEEVAGLEVQHNEEWIPVEPTPGALVISIGDTLEVLTNGRYKGVMHRALVNSERERMSIVFATGPSMDWKLGPIPQLLGPDNPAIFRSLPHGEYCRLRLATKYDSKRYVYTDFGMQKNPDSLSMSGLDLSAIGHCS